MRNLGLSNRLRSIVRELAEKAHEREMRKILAPVADAFAQWRSGKKETWTLLKDMDRISVPRRRLYERYESKNSAPMMVAYALVVGLLREDEVPKEVVDALERPIAFYRQGFADGTVSMDEED
jgi:hypothetical protein